MTITEEITLRGFKSDIHAFGYQLANTSPVPEELGLNRFRFGLFYPQISFSHIFPNVSNIYLCGSGSHPGPGISMAPGRNAAQVILRDLEIDFRSMVAL
jgi:phytoene dehydrogenase-like protein